MFEKKAMSFKVSKSLTNQLTLMNEKEEKESKESSNLDKKKPVEKKLTSFNYSRMLYKPGTITPKKNKAFSVSVRNIEVR